LLNKVSEKNIFIKDKDLHLKDITVEEIYKMNRLDIHDVNDEDNEDDEGSKKKGWIDIDEVSKDGDLETTKEARMKEGLDNLLEIIISSDDED